MIIIYSSRFSYLLPIQYLVTMDSDPTPSAEQNQSGGDLRAAVQNPVGALISIPFKFTFD